MTDLDIFAAFAMHKMLISEADTDDVECLAEKAYVVAEVMLEVRETFKGQGK